MNAFRRRRKPAVWRSGKPPRERHPICCSPPTTFSSTPTIPKSCTRSAKAGSVIQYSRDGGANWFTDAVLTDIATNHGEYRIAYEGSRTIDSPDVPWTDGCSLSGMGFDAFTGDVRVAALFYGGIAFSRDAGKDWMALDITDNDHFVSANLTQIVTSVFFDAETHGKGKKVSPIPGPDQLIYFVSRVRVCAWWPGRFSISNRWTSPTRPRARCRFQQT
jgi:hypothetical protein